jgi:DNA-binding MurR/RpiR family transcriptional regulator
MSQTQHLSLPERVAELGPSLSPVSQRIAQYLVDAGPEVVLLSAADLAAELGTSDASVIRTAKALGYSGLAELRRAISTSTREPSLEVRLQRSLDEGETSESILHSLIGHHVASLQGLARRIEPELFQQAIDVLANAVRIVWCGTGPSAAIAEYGAALSSRLGWPSTVARGMGTQLADELLAIRPGDAVVVLAYGRKNSRARSIIDRCEELGVPTVLITDSIPRELSRRFNTILPCGRGTPGLFSSHGTTLVLIEALALGLAATDPVRAQASLAQLNDLRAAIAGRRRDVYLA